jgi:hypothetical protein
MLDGLLYIFELAGGRRVCFDFDAGLLIAVD